MHAEPERGGEISPKIPKLAWAVAGGVVAVAAAALVLVQARHASVDKQNRSLATAVTKMAQLATAQAQVSNYQLRRDSKPLFGFLPVKCEKTVAVFYRGRVVAGFDLAASTNTVVRVDNGTRMTVRLPAPRVLSAEVPAPELIVADGSVCNRLGADDYARLHEDARKAVIDEALAAGVLGKAEEQARALIVGLIAPFGLSLDLAIAQTEN